jgi:hypothetical protein
MTMARPFKLVAHCVRVPVVFMMPPLIVRLVVVARVEPSHSIRSAAGELCKAVGAAATGPSEIGAPLGPVLGEERKSSLHGQTGAFDPATDIGRLARTGCRIAGIGGSVRWLHRLTLRYTMPRRLNAIIISRWLKSCSPARRYR